MCRAPVTSLARYFQPAAATSERCSPRSRVDSARLKTPRGVGVPRQTPPRRRPSAGEESFPGVECLQLLHCGPSYAELSWQLAAGKSRCGVSFLKKSFSSVNQRKKENGQPKGG